MKGEYDAKFLADEARIGENERLLAGLEKNTDGTSKTVAEHVTQKISEIPAFDPTKNDYIIGIKNTADAAKGTADSNKLVLDNTVVPAINDLSTTINTAITTHYTNTVEPIVSAKLDATTYTTFKTDEFAPLKSKVEGFIDTTYAQDEQERDERFSDIEEAIGSGFAEGNTVAQNIDAVKTDLNTLFGDYKDKKTSVAAIATDVITTLLAIDTEDSDEVKTLEELISWLNAHPSDALAMNQAIQDLQTYQDDTVKGAVEKVNKIYSKFVASVAKGNTGTYVQHSVTATDDANGGKNITIAIDETKLAEKLNALQEGVDNAALATEVVKSIQGKTGAVTLDINNSTNGQVKFAIDNNNLITASVNGLGSAAYTNANAYATAAQGALADTAVQNGESGNATYLTVTKNTDKKLVVTPVMGDFSKNSAGLADVVAVKTYVEDMFTWAQFD